MEPIRLVHGAGRQHPVIVRSVEKRAQALGGSPLAWRIAAGNVALVQDPDSALAAQVRAMDALVVSAFGRFGPWSARFRLLTSASKPALEAAQ